MKDKILSTKVVQILETIRSQKNQHRLQLIKNSQQLMKLQ